LVGITEEDPFVVVLSDFERQGFQANLEGDFLRLKMHRSTCKMDSSFHRLVSKFGVKGARLEVLMPETQSTMDLAQLFAPVTSFCRRDFT
jgi:hypothetical protein